MDTPTDVLSVFPPEIIEDPFPMYDVLREQGPATYLEPLDVWVVTSYSTVRQILRRPDEFKQWDGSEMFGPGEGPPLGNSELWAPEVREVMETGYPIIDTLVTANDPDHMRYRQVVNEAWSARRTADAMDGRIREIATELAEQLGADGRADVVEEFTIPLPLRVIAEILSVPPEDFQTFKRWSDEAVIALGGGVDRETLVRSAHSIIEFQNYFAPIIDKRRHDPDDDVISVMASMEPEGGPLDTAEMLSIMTQMLVAGNETTTNLLGSALWRILGDTAIRDQLVAEPHLIPHAVEETLRQESPVQGLFRRVVKTAEVDGVTFPEGAKVLVSYGAANRDEEKFSCPHEYDVTRDNAHQHMAFGFGKHFCIGAPLARREATIGLELLLRRHPTMELVPDAQIAHNLHPLLRGLASLQVTL